MYAIGGGSSSYCMVGMGGWDVGWLCIGVLFTCLKFLGSVATWSGMESQVK